MSAGDSRKDAGKRTELLTFALWAIFSVALDSPEVATRMLH